MRKLMMSLMITIFCANMCLGCGLAESKSDVNADINSGELRDTVFALASSAENSSTDCESQYVYIEDIGDGRG